MLGIFHVFLLASAEFSKLVWFFVIFFLQTNLSETLSEFPNGLDPDQGRLDVGSDLGPSCFQSLSTDDKSRR